jgi:hypothetical protein
MEFLELAHGNPFFQFNGNYMNTDKISFLQGLPKEGSGNQYERKNEY